MDTRKITLIATIAVIALVAVGVGYAYTATTQNTANNASSNYIVLSQNVYSWGTQQLYYDTINTAAVDGGTTYILTQSNDTPAGLKKQSKQANFMEWLLEHPTLLQQLQPVQQYQQHRTK